MKTQDVVTIRMATYQTRADQYTYMDTLMGQFTVKDKVVVPMGGTKISKPLVRSGVNKASGGTEEGRIYYCQEDMTADEARHTLLAILYDELENEKMVYNQKAREINHLMDVISEEIHDGAGD